MLRRHSDEKRGDICLACGHPWNEHDQFMEGAGKILIPGYNPKRYNDLYQCKHYMGMGDWCGCEEGSRQPAIPEGLR